MYQALINVSYPTNNMNNDSQNIASGASSTGSRMNESEESPSRGLSEKQLRLDLTAEWNLQCCTLPLKGMSPFELACMNSITTACAEEENRDFLINFTNSIKDIDDDILKRFCDSNRLIELKKRTLKTDKESPLNSPPPKRVKVRFNTGTETEDADSSPQQLNSPIVREKKTSLESSVARALLTMQNGNVVT